MVKINRVDYTNEIGKYMVVADEIEKVETDMILELKFKVVN